MEGIAMKKLFFGIGLCTFAYMHTSMAMIDAEKNTTKNKTFIQSFQSTQHHGQLCFIDFDHSGKFMAIGYNNYVEVVHVETNIVIARAKKEDIFYIAFNGSNIDICAGKTNKKYTWNWKNELSPNLNDMDGNTYEIIDFHICPCPYNIGLQACINEKNITIASNLHTYVFHRLLAKKLQHEKATPACNISNPFCPNLEKFSLLENLHSIQKKLSHNNQSFLFKTNENTIKARKKHKSSLDIRYLFDKKNVMAKKTFSSTQSLFDSKKNLVRMLLEASTIPTRKLVGQHKENIFSVKWLNNPNKCFLASASAHEIIIWNTAKEQCVERIDIEKDKIKSIAWHPQYGDEYAIIALGLKSGQVQLHKIKIEQ